MSQPESGGAADEGESPSYALARHYQDRGPESVFLLAALAGIHVTYLSGIERGVRNPSLRNICRIAKTSSRLKGRKPESLTGYCLCLWVQVRVLLIVSISSSGK